MEEEVDQHIMNNNWTLVMRLEAPEGVPIITAVRTMQTREVYKWKA